MYIKLPADGAIWIEWNKLSWSPMVEKDRGEYFLWLGKLYVIFTPVGWKAPTSSRRRVREAFSSQGQRSARQGTKAS